MHTTVGGNWQTAWAIFSPWCYNLAVEQFYLSVILEFGIQWGLDRIWDFIMIQATLSKLKGWSPKSRYTHTTSGVKMALGREPYIHIWLSPPWEPCWLPGDPQPAWFPWEPKSSWLSRGPGPYNSVFSEMVAIISSPKCLHRQSLNGSNWPEREFYV